jgi:outer membrane pore protein C
MVRDTASSASYSFGAGFKAVGALTRSGRTAAQNSDAGIMGEGDKAEAYSASLKYDAHNLYLAVMYTQAFNARGLAAAVQTGIYGYANRSDIIELFAQYTFDTGWVPFNRL